MDERATDFTISDATELAVSPCVANRRDPGREEVGAEGEQVPAVFDVEVGQRLLAEHTLYGGPKHPLIHRLKGKMPPAIRLHEAVDHNRQVPAQRLSRQHHSVGIVAIPKPFKANL